ncbi:MAG TPA: alpha/beta fold hydrolase [Dehalococcoidales bacterium]|nr:alpha/beta fold hydrolase [Dehalococcoidales bacterium]
MGKIQSKTINIDGLDVHYYTAGQGEPLVVIHGGGGDARTWWDNITELSKKYTVYAPDLPGYGGSQPLDGKYFIPELSEFIEKFAVKLGLEKFNLVGHSLGGGVALNYALRSSHRIKKLVLVSSLCLGRDIALWVRLLSIPAMLRSVGALSLAVLSGVKWLLMRMLNPAEFIMPLSPASVYVGGSITTFRQQKLVLESRLSEIRVPTLLVWGAKDPIVPVRQAYAAARVIPDCQVKVFENCGHNVHRDELRQFSDTLNGFLG